MSHSLGVIAKIGLGRARGCHFWHYGGSFGRLTTSIQSQSYGSYKKSVHIKVVTFNELKPIAIGSFPLKLVFLSKMGDTIYFILGHADPNFDTKITIFDYPVNF